jgi:folate-binding protein YgfZ
MHPDWQSFLTQQDARIESGAVTGFGPPGSDALASREATVLCDLSHEGLILASGDDAASFLHGQFTNDVQALKEGDTQLNGYCSPKGRLLATFLMWPAKQGFLIQLPRELLEPIRKRLSMFVLRAKVKLEDVSDQWARFGLAGQEAETLLRNHFGAVPERVASTWHGGEAGNGVRIIRLAERRFEVVGAVKAVQDAWNVVAAKAEKTGRGTWDRLVIHEGIPSVVPATQEAFVPQMVNFELIGGVNFRKGCYPGQEIVARTQYRGILKRRMALAHVDSPEAPQAGESVYSAEFGDQAAGQIVNSAAAPDGGFDVLVAAQIDSLRGGALKWKAPDGPALTLKPLPYSVPLSDTEELQRA